MSHVNVTTMAAGNAYLNDGLLLRHFLQTAEIDMPVNHVKRETVMNSLLNASGITSDCQFAKQYQLMVTQISPNWQKTIQQRDSDQH